MPRYFFDLYDDFISIDEEGAELENVAAAHAKAIECAQGMAADEVSHGGLNLTHFITVRDEDRQPLFVVRFDEAVKVER